MLKPSAKEPSNEPNKIGRDRWMVQKQEEEQQHHVVLLTLECHKDGVWITRLVEALQRQESNATTTVLTVESMLQLDSAPLTAQLHNNVFLDSTTVLVNRVSDAAEPKLVKACIAILHLAASTGIRVINGAAAYALCTNKWCHHVLFARARLASPRTMKFFQPTIATIQRAAEQPFWSDPPVQRFLLKPNAGGFGEGIIAFQRSELNAMTELPIVEVSSDDDMILLQEYHEVSHVYRVWFLNGRVLCGTVRSVDAATATLLFNGCAAGDTAQQHAEPYLVPSEVCHEIEEQLLPLLPKDAYTGSVEFLYNGDDERLYFDLNLLSTFPLGRSDVWDAFALILLGRR